MGIDVLITPFPEWDSNYDEPEPEDFKSNDDYEKARKIHYDGTHPMWLCHSLIRHTVINRNTGRFSIYPNGPFHMKTVKEVVELMKENIELVKSLAKTNETHPDINSNDWEMSEVAETMEKLMKAVDALPDDWIFISSP